MTTKTSTKIISRLTSIESLLGCCYNTYNHAARHSAQSMLALTAISNLESERRMLDAALIATKQHS